MTSPEFCIFDHIDSRGEPVSKLYRDRLAFAGEVERAGFTGYYIAEHHSTPLGHAPSPNVFLAALAQHTHRIRIGAMVYVLPTYNPLRLYEEICMLDHLSDGRIDMGIGRGASPFETGLYGVAPQLSRHMFEEALEALKAAFAGDTLSHRGEFYRYYDVPLAMRPLQPGGPPMWYGAFSERNLDFAARNGLNITLNGPPPRLRALRQRYRDLWAETYPDRAMPGVACLYQMFVGETDAEAERIAAGAFDVWLGSMLHLWRANNAMPRETLPTDFATAMKRGTFIVGSAATVRDRLAAILSESGIERLLLQCNMGSIPHEEAVAGVNRFAVEVAPHLAIAEPQPPLKLAS